MPKELKPVLPVSKMRGRAAGHAERMAASRCSAGAPPMLCVQGHITRAAWQERAKSRGSRRKERLPYTDGTTYYAEKRRILRRAAASCAVPETRSEAEKQREQREGLRPAKKKAKRKERVPEWLPGSHVLPAKKMAAAAERAAKERANRNGKVLADVVQAEKARRRGAGAERVEKRQAKAKPETGSRKRLREKLARRLIEFLLMFRRRKPRKRRMWLAISKRE